MERSKKFVKRYFAATMKLTSVIFAVLIVLLNIHSFYAQLTELDAEDEDSSIVSELI